jgi:hypothetical protein
MGGIIIMLEASIVIVKVSLGRKSSCGIQALIDLFQKNRNIIGAREAIV